MNGNQTAEANFTLEKVTLIMAVAGTGSGTTDPAVGTYTLAYDYGEVVDIEAIEGIGSDFTGWSTNANIDDDTAAITTVTMNGNQTAEANFTITQYTITATAGPGGTISPIGVVIVNHGANQSFNMYPDLEYRVLDVLVDGASVGPVATYDFINVTASHTIHVTFELNPCCDLEAKLTVNSVEWYKDPSDSIWKVKTDCKVVDNTCGYWLTVKAELIDDSSGLVVDVDANVSHGQKFTAKSTLSSTLGGDTAPTGYSVRISFYDRDELCEPYVQEDIPPSI